VKSLAGSRRSTPPARQAAVARVKHEGDHARGGGERLGWDYTFKTELRAAADRNGVRAISSSSAAAIEFRQLGRTATPSSSVGGALQSWCLAHQGRIVGDDDVFDDEPFGAGWSWDDADRSFAA
jgi:hypothetical protein